MTSIFYGDDTFSADEALRAMYASVGPSELWESNIIQMDGPVFSVGADMFLTKKMR